MKKLLLIGLAILGTLATTSCSIIENITNPEKEYNYNDFKALLADKKITFDATKCSSEIEEDGKKSTKEYTYDASSATWKYEYEEGGIKWTGVKELFIIGDTKTCELAAAFADTTVDQLFKFYAKKNSYRITGEYSDDKQRVKLEYKYGEDGLKTYSYEKNTDLKTIVTTETTETFEYSK